MIVRQRLQYATEAALAVEQAQSLLYERLGAVEEVAELVAARELLRLHMHEHSHQQLGWERNHRHVEGRNQLTPNACNSYCTLLVEFEFEFELRYNRIYNHI